MGPRRGNISARDTSPKKLRRSTPEKPTDTRGRTDAHSCPRRQLLLAEAKALAAPGGRSAADSVLGLTAFFGRGFGRSLPWHLAGRSSSSRVGGRGRTNFQPWAPSNGLPAHKRTSPSQSDCRTNFRRFHSWAGRGPTGPPRAWYASALHGHMCESKVSIVNGLDSSFALEPHVIATSAVSVVIFRTPLGT